MATKAIQTQGIKLQRGDGAVGTEVFATIGEITNFSGPNESAKQIDVTSLDSTSREYIAGLRDGGEVTFEFNFVGTDTMQQGLRSDLAQRLTRNFKIVLTDSLTTPTTIAFAAVVTAFGIKGSIDDRVIGNASLKISGDPTYTYAGAPVGG